MANGRLTDRKDGLWARIKRIALTDVGALMRGLNADDLEKLERVLIEADFFNDANGSRRKIDGYTWVL